MKRLLKVALVLMPVFVVPVMVNAIRVSTRDARELLFQSILIIALGVVIGNKWIKAFLCWATAMWWWNYFLPVQSTAVLFNIAFGFLAFYLIKQCIKPKDIDGILKVVCITALFQVAWLGVQALGKDFVFYPITAAGNRMAGNVKLVGFLGNKAILGAYLGLCLPLFRVYFKWLIPIVIIGLLVARSSIGIIAGFSGLICFELFMAIANKKYHKVLIVIAICLILFGGFIFKLDKIGFERFEIWQKLITQTMNWKCTVGQGLGKFQTLRVIDKSTTVWDNPHNEYLQVYFELGFVGIFFVFGYLIDLFRRFLKYRTEKTVMLFSCVVVVLINSLANFPFQIAATAFLGITMFALLENLLCQNRQRVLSMN